MWNLSEENLGLNTSIMASVIRIVLMLFTPRTIPLSAYVVLLSLLQFSCQACIHKHGDLRPQVRELRSRSEGGEGCQSTCGTNRAYQLRRVLRGFCQGQPCQETDDATPSTQSERLTILCRRRLHDQWLVCG